MTALRAAVLASAFPSAHNFAMHKNRVRFSSRFNPTPPPSTRCCDVPGCAESGEYRAPKGRDQLNDYFWFCLGHVREYNKAWDYYAGMSESEIEAHVRSDTTWQRPSWPMGNWRARERAMREEAMRQQGFGRTENGGAGGAEDGTEHYGSLHRRRSEEEEALAQLELEPPVDFAQIKARYRELVKIHHPDANGGDKLAEERIKRINQAYTTLKASYGV
jgi:DnaJ-domain-containing protein 1